MNISSPKTEIKETISLGLPIVLGQLGIIGMSVADTIQVGMIPQKGTVSLDAAGLGNGLFYTIAIVGMITLGVVSPMISKADAEQNPQRVHQLFGAVLRASLIGSAVTMFLQIVFTYYLEVLGQEPEVTQLARQYSWVITLSVLPQFVFLAIKQLSDGLGHTKIGMIVTVVAFFLNVFLNWLFIFGIWIFPELGLVGAGVATLLSRIFMCVVLWILVKKRGLIPSQPIEGSLHETVRHIFKVGIPAGFQGFFESSVFWIALIMTGWIDRFQQAGHLIALNMCSVTYMMVLGFASAGGIRVGHAWGLKDKNLIKQAGTAALIVATVFMSFWAVFFIAFNWFLVSLYTHDPAVVPVALTLLVVGGFFQVSDGIQATALGILRGITDVKIPTAITLFAYWVVCLPVGYYLGFAGGLKSQGIWWGLTIGLTVSAVLLCFRFYRTVRKMNLYANDSL
jgi:multidrug resistance protein, MATE family